MSERALSERELFEAALERPVSERAQFLKEACAGDARLRGQVEALLARHREADSFLERPAGELTCAPVPMSEKPGTKIGPYKLLQRIGEGGFGVVYMAEQERPVRRKVALKIIKPGMDTDQVIARFESERQALALMDHPHIARVLDAGATDSGRPYFVMELVKGVPITEFCDKNRMSTAGRLKLFIDVCHAIQHAHHKGVIHRDIKPSNVMVTLHDGEPVVKVIDFGVAKATVQKLTERTLFTAYGQMIGTPAYMSPEQAEMSGLDIDTRSDVYSLGVLLYELLTGTTPLENKRLRLAGYVEMQRLIREEEAPRPSDRLSSLGDSATILAGQRGLDVRHLVKLLSGDLDWVVMKALDKDRNRRYATPGSFSEDIERYLGQETVLARPPSAAYRLRKFVQRNKVAVLTVGTMAAILLVGIAGTTYGLFREASQRSIAEAETQRAAAEQHKAEAALAQTTVSEQKAQASLAKAKESEGKAVEARRAALRQAALSGCDVAQQLGEKNSVALAIMEYGRALQFAHEANDADLEDAIRWNIGAWRNELHPLAYTVPAPVGARPAAAFHPDGKLLAVASRSTGSDTSLVQLHNVADGSPRPETLRLKRVIRVVWLAWHPDDKQLAIYGNDGQIHLWTPGQPVPSISFRVSRPLEYNDGHRNTQMAFSPDGRRLIAGTYESVVKVFDVETGKPTGIELPQPSDMTTAADWSRDGSWLLTGNVTGVVKIWEAATGKLVRTINAGSELGSAHFSPDSKLVVTATGWNSDRGGPKVQVWNAQTGVPVGFPMKHRENVYDAEISPDGKLVAIAENSCEVFVREVATGRIVGAPIWTGGSSARASFRSDGRAILTNTHGSLRVWNLGEGMSCPPIPFNDLERLRLNAAVELYKKSNPSAGWHAFKLSTDGTRLLKFSVDKSAPVDLIDARTQTRIFELPGGTRGVREVYWKPDGKEFLTSSWLRTEVRDSATGSAKSDLGQCSMWTGSFRPDGARFAIAWLDYGLRIFDTSTWKAIGPVLRHANPVHSSTYSEDGKLVLTSDASKTTRLWHAATGKRIGPVLAGVWPRVCPGNRVFFTREGQFYRMPSPSAGTVADVVRQVEGLTGQYGVVATESEPTTEPHETIDARQAIASVDQSVILEMTIRSLEFNSKREQEWMYLYSETDKKNPAKMTVAVKYPTAERRKAFGLDLEREELVGRQIRVTGKVVLYRDAPEIIVLDTDQFRLLPKRSEDPKSNPAAKPRGPLDVRQAAAAIDETVILEMTVKGTGMNAAGTWMYLNSESDYRNPANLNVAVKDPTAARRKAMGLPPENPDIVGLRIRVTGRVYLFSGYPEIIVEETEQLRSLPKSADELKSSPAEVKPRGPLDVRQAAAAAIDETVILEMTIGSVGFNNAGNWMYLNSEANFKNAENLIVAVKDPSPERRKAMGLDGRKEDLVGRQIRVTGKVGRYRDNPQIVVDEPTKLRLLPK
jgi:eukaryotic-like serine/threonine-protein kinase